jgi:hypothetical protein
MGQFLTVATTPGMGFQVTPGSIAFAAVKVNSCEHVQTEQVLMFPQPHLAPHTAPQWREVYDGVNYKVYWFIVDYLESGSTDVEELHDWRNKYAFNYLTKSVFNIFLQANFPDATPPQDSSTHAAAEPPTAVLMEQERGGSERG